MPKNFLTTGRIARILVKLLPLFSFIVPVVILYFLDPMVFEKTWKGRIFYIFFLWLVSLETILGWEELEDQKIKKLRSARNVAFIAALFMPTIYVIVANFYGLNGLIADLAGRSGIFWASIMPLSTEYLVFMMLFLVIILLRYGIRGLKTHSISALFLGVIGMVYTIDNVYPQGSFTPFQMIVPTTARLAANFLNLMGYHTIWRGSYQGAPVLEALDSSGKSSGPTAIAWPCAGVESLLIYAVTILLFLKNSDISWRQRTIYFVIGAAVTYFINILRIVTIFVIAINSGFGAAMTFHDYYGQLYSITWITSYPLLIIGSRAFWGKIRPNAAATKDAIPTS
jgi:exosortase/archaeosortase family protein